MGGVLFFGVHAVQAAGATYYVDARLGDNGNDGLSPSKPWRTLSRVSGAALKPGDAVLFRRGEAWRGQLDIAASGEQNGAITYGAYGDGGRPAFYGSALLAQWSPLGGGLWSSSSTIATSSSLWLVHGDGSSQHLMPATSSAALEEGRYFIGPAEVRIRIAESYAAVPEVEASDKDTCIAGWGAKSYIAMQDIECAYYRDAGVRSSDSGSASSHWAVSSMAIHDISAPDESGGDGIVMGGNSASSIRDSSIMRVAGHGIYLVSNKASTGDMAVEEVSVRDACGGGIAIAHVGAEGASDRYAVRYNTVYDTYGKSGMASCESRSPAGIQVQGLEGGRVTGVTVAYNTVHDMLGSGIRFEGSYEDAQILNNTIVDTRNKGTACIALFGAGSSARVMNTACSNKNNGLLAMTDTAGKTVDYNDWFRASPGPLFSIGEYGARTYKEYLIFAGYQKATGFDAHSMAADPVFVDAENDSFYPRQLSPVIDRGTDVGLSRDFAGTYVPQGSAPDIGAYEYAGAGPVFDQGQSFVDALQRIARRVSDIIAVFGRWGLLGK
jgi:hypothetical protein